MIIDLLKENKNQLKYTSIHFCVNSLTFDIDYEISSIIKGNYPQASSKYIKEIQILIKNGDCWHNHVEIISEGLNHIDLSNTVYKNDSVEVLIYVPILAELKKLDIILSDDAKLKFVSDDKKMLVAGGVHSFGMGCTSAGNMFSNIISRKSNVQTSNISVYDRNFLDKIYAVLNGENMFFDYGILEVDYCNQDKFIVEKYLDKAVNEMLIHCDKLICWFTLPPNFRYKKSMIASYLEPYLSGDEMILLDLSIVYDDKIVDKCTSSNNYINDTANVLIYKNIYNSMRFL